MGNRRMGLARLEALLEAVDRDLNLANTTLTSPTIVDAVSASITGKLVVSGRIREALTLENVDAQNLTVTAARFLKGLLVHTSASGAGTATLDTGPNLISGLGLTVVGQAMECIYVNDGNQTVTFAVASGTTITNVANTVLTNSSCTLICRMTAATTVDVTIANN